MQSLLIYLGRAVLILFLVISLPSSSLKEKDFKFDEVWKIIQETALYLPPNTATQKEACAWGITTGDIAACLPSDPWAALLPTRVLNNVKQKLLVPEMYVNHIREDITYIKINTISVSVPIHLLSAMNSQNGVITKTGEKSQTLISHAHGFILDLRFNGGGLVVSTKNLLELFANSPSEILFTERTRVKEVINYAKDTQLSRQNAFNALQITPLEQKTLGALAGAHVAIIVNDKTASAAETIATFLKAKGRPVIGIRTYGKGLAQAHFNIQGGTFALSTAEVLVGEERIRIETIGVEPNYFVPADNAKTIHKFHSDHSYDTLDQLLKDDPQFQKAFEILEQKLSKK